MPHGARASSAGDLRPTFNPAELSTIGPCTDVGTTFAPTAVALAVALTSAPTAALTAALTVHSGVGGGGGRPTAEGLGHAASDCVVNDKVTPQWWRRLGCSGPDGEQQQRTTHFEARQTALLKNETCGTLYAAARCFEIEGPRLFDLQAHGHVRVSSFGPDIARSRKGSIPLLFSAFLFSLLNTLFVKPIQNRISPQPRGGICRDT